MRLTEENIGLEDIAVRASDTDRFYDATIPFFFSSSQEVAGEHATLFGMGISELSASEQKTWVIVRTRMDFARIPKWREKLTFETFPQKGYKLFCPRVVMARDEKGEPVMNAMTHWVLMDLVRKRPIPAKMVEDRFNIKYTDSLERMAAHLLNTVPTIIVKDKLQELFGFKSHHTLGNYLSYLVQTYLICTVSKYSAKSKERSVAEKAYAIDVAFMNKRENALAGKNLGWRLETIVYLELRRRIKTEEEDIYYFNNGNTEADFMVCDGNTVKSIYQVAYDISTPKTRRREINGAATAAKHTRCDNIYILTDHQRETIIHDNVNIKVMPVWEWIVTG